MMMDMEREERRKNRNRKRDETNQNIEFKTKQRKWWILQQKERKYIIKQRKNTEREWNSMGSFINGDSKALFLKIKWW